MNVKINRKTGLPEFEIDKKDEADATVIKAMMQHEGWTRLQAYLEAGREQIIEAGKNGISLRTKKDLSPEKWAILKGWDEATIMAERIVLRVEEFKKKQKEEKDNARTNDEELGD